MAINPALASVLGIKEDLLVWLNELGATDADVSVQGFLGKARDLYPHYEGAKAAGVSQEQLIGIMKNPSWISPKLEIFFKLLPHHKAIEELGTKVLEVAEKYAHHEGSGLVILLPYHEALKDLGTNAFEEVKKYRAQTISNLAQLLPHHKAIEELGTNALEVAKTWRYYQVNHLAKLLPYHKISQDLGINIIEQAKTMFTETVDVLATRLEFFADNKGALDALFNKDILKAMCLNYEVTTDVLKKKLTEAAQSQAPEKAAKQQEEVAIYEVR